MYILKSFFKVFGIFTIAFIIIISIISLVNETRDLGERLRRLQVILELPAHSKEVDAKIQAYRGENNK